MVCPQRGYNSTGIIKPETLACYRVHADTLTQSLVSNAKTANDVRRTLELFARTLPKDVAEKALPTARIPRTSLPRDCTVLPPFRKPQVGDSFFAEALAIDPDGPGRTEFAELPAATKRAGHAVTKLRVTILRMIQ